jgi:hypothetical protein
LSSPTFVVLKLMFLVLVSRWCEPVEPWTCTRRSLRTPSSSTFPIVVSSGRSRPAASHTECSNTEDGGEWGALRGLRAAAAATPAARDIVLKLLGETPTCVRWGHGSIGGRQLASHTDAKFGLLRCSEAQKTLFAAQELHGSMSAWSAIFTTTLPDGYQVLFVESHEAFRGHHIPDNLMDRK